MNQRRMAAAALAAMMALMMLAGCGDGSANGGSAKTFTVGMECNYAPFNWTQVEGDDYSVALEGAGHAGGYDVMMAKTLAEKMGATLVIKKLAWEGLEPAVTSGEIDAIIAGMTATPERKENADFTTPYYESEMVCIVRADDPLAKATSLADFTGKNVQGQQNTLYDEIIDQIPGVVTSNPNLAIVRFADGQGFEADTTVSIAVKKGNTELLNSIQAALDTINTDTRNQWMTDAVSRQPANAD